MMSELRVPLHDSLVLMTAFRLRGMLSDFVDCLILSSAIHQSDLMVTEDTDIQKASKEKAFQEVIEKINPKFKIQKLQGIL